MKVIRLVVYGKIRTHNKTTYTEKHGIRHWKDRMLNFKPSTTSNQKSKQGMGYRVDLWKNGKPHTLLVARLVATTFLEDLINTNMTVNHKNGNRLDNRVENLEWLSRKDNIRYGFNNSQYTCCKKCSLIDSKGNKINFISLAKASEYLKRNKAYISLCLKTNRKITDHKGDEYKIEVNYDRKSN